MDNQLLSDLGPVDRQLAVFDFTDMENAAFAVIVLKLDFSAEVAELRRYIFDVIGKCQFRLVLTEGLCR